MPQARIHAALSLDGLGDDARAAFSLAADAGYTGIAIPTNHPQLTPDQLGDTARRHLRKTLDSRSLAIDAIRVAAPRAGLTDPATIDRTIDNARQAIALAHALGVRTVALHTGAISALKVTPDTLQSAARLLAAEADRAGVTLALSADATPQLRDLLTAVAYDQARANLHTAGSIASGEDPLKAAELLAGSLAEVTLGDAIRAGQAARLVELGEGQLPLSDLLAHLREQDFHGPMVVDVRELPRNADAARHAAETLRRALTTRM